MDKFMEIEIPEPAPAQCGGTSEIVTSPEVRALYVYGFNYFYSWTIHFFLAEGLDIQIAASLPPN